MAKKKFNPNDMVYLVSDPDQLQRQIIAVMDFGGHYEYLLACGTERSEHYEHEISKDRNNLLLMGLEEKEVPDNTN